MIGQIIGYREFVDGTRRLIYLDAQGQLSWTMRLSASTAYGLFGKRNAAIGR
jgi:hypothetical protein